MKNEVKKESSSADGVSKKEQASEPKALRLVNEKKSSDGLKKIKMTEIELPESVGALLKAERLKYGKSLGEVAHTLRISKQYLEIIEEGMKKDFPERVYILGFVRSYAVYLGLNADDITKRFKIELLGDYQQEPLVFLLPEAELSSPRGMILIVSAFVALLCIAGWYFYQHSNDISVAKEIPAELQKAIQDDLSPVPQKTHVSDGAETPEQPDQALQAQGGVASAIDEDSGPAEEDEESTEHSLPEASLSSKETQNSEDVTGNTPLKTLNAPAQMEQSTPQLGVQPGATGQEVAAKETPSATPIAEMAMSVNLTFVEKCWVEVKDSNQKIIVQKSFYPGDVYAVNAKSGRQLSVGNAGGVKISVNDSKPVVLGGSGIVTRISLDPTNLLKYSLPQH